MRNSKRFGVLPAALLVTAMAVVASCGDDDGCCYVDDLSNTPSFIGHGPYPVGLRTEQLSDRQVDILYPAEPGTDLGQPVATYSQTEPFDSLIRTFLDNLARRNGIDLTFEMSAVRDLPVASGRRFPVVLFSHGFGGWRTVNSALLAGIASWGFIVTSADHLERGLNAVANNMAHPDAEKDRAVMLETLALLAAFDANSDGVFFQRIELDHVAAAGHSAGGATALSLLEQAEIDTVIGFASVGEVSAPPAKPTLLIAAREDIIVTPDFTRQLFTTLAAPKRMVIIAAAGHNSFTDSCLELRRGNSLTELARLAGFPISEELLRLGENGCAATDLAPETVWAISQHFAVAHLRNVFGIGGFPAEIAPGLGAGVVAALPAGVEYQTQL